MTGKFANKLRRFVNERINYLLLATVLLDTFFSGTANRIVAISTPTVAGSLGTDLIGLSWTHLSYQLSLAAAATSLAQGGEKAESVRSFSLT